jgi:hypothetical protein
MDAIEFSELPVKSDLMKRYDRKFLCSVNQLDELLGHLVADHCYVHIMGQRHQLYENQYWDLPAKEFYHDHRRGIPRRLKFRRRIYQSNGLSFWELKVRHPRGFQDKRRIPVSVLGVGDVSDSVQANRVFGHLLGADYWRHKGSGDLLPSMKINYQRMTLWGPQNGVRLTVDTQLRASLDGLQIEFPGWSLVELKQARRERHAVDGLAAQGLLRPCSFSKYHQTMQIWTDWSKGYSSGSSEMRRWAGWMGHDFKVQEGYPH